MKEKKMSDNIAKCIAFIVAIILLGLGAGAIRCYFVGKSAVAEGTAEYIFTRESAANFLGVFFLPTVLLVVFLILYVVAKRKEKEDKENKEESLKSSSQYTEEIKQAESVCAGKKRSWQIYLIFYAIALLLIVVGIVNGGIRDVLIKAIAICTECIGLG